MWWTPKDQGITQLAVSGFKSIAKECEIDIRPLTILAGTNGSGKSNIMQPLLMLKQTLEAMYDPGPLLLNGPNVQFTSAEQFLSKLVGEKETDRFQIRIDTDAFETAYSMRMIFRAGASGIEIVEMSRERKLKTQYPWPPQYVAIYPEMPPEELKPISDKCWIPKDVEVVTRSRCFLGLESQDGERHVNLAANLESNIFNIIHLPISRGNLDRIDKLTSTGPKYPSTFENYVASIIHEWQETSSSCLSTLAHTLYTLGLTGQVRAEKIQDTLIELKVGRLLHRGTGKINMVSIADAGYGVSQVLPVLVALIGAEPGQLVYIEQPELHLHPRAQVALAQVLADAAKRGVRVVAETHSSLLLLGVQTLVVEGSLSPDLVKLHWFTRDENGETEVSSADLDKLGAYGDWPEDFAEVDLKAQSRYLDAADSVGFGNPEAS